MKNPIIENNLFTTPGSPGALMSCIEQQPEGMQYSLHLVRWMTYNLCAKLVDEALHEHEYRTKPDRHLIDKVLQQIREDVGKEDLTAIEELVKTCPVDFLQGFLSEENWK